MDEPQQSPPPAMNTTPVAPTPAAPRPVPFVPPVAATPPPVVVVTPPPSGSHTGLLVGILVALLILAAAAYYFFYRTAGEVTESPTPSASTISSPITVEQKTFADGSYRFTFRYPDDWYLRQDDAAGTVNIENTQKRVWLGLDAPENPNLVASGTNVQIRQLPAESLQAFIQSQMIADETYATSSYDGLLKRQGGQLPGTAGQENYLAWGNGFGVSITLNRSSGITPDRDALQQILSTFKFTQ